MLSVLLQSPQASNGSLSFFILLLLFALLSSRKGPGFITSLSALVVCSAVIFFIFELSSNKLTPPTVPHAIVQIIFWVILIPLYFLLGLKYFKLVTKHDKDKHDILRRKRYIISITYLLAITFTAIPYIVNSWGCPIIGKSHIGDSIFSIMIFLRNGLQLGIVISMAVFFADNILSRLSSPILTVEETIELDKFCLYLRSFSKDNNSQEKLICKTINNLYPIYAIGDPRSVLQPNGAQRIYVTNSEWKDCVSQLSIKSKLIILRIGSSKGTTWELSNIIKSNLIYKTIFVAYSSEDLDHFIPLFQSGIGLEYNLQFNINNYPIAFFWDSEMKLTCKFIKRRKDIEEIINIYLSKNPVLDQEYSIDLELRNNCLKYLFNSEKIPSLIRNSINWGVISPFINMRHWPLKFWFMFFICFIISCVLAEYVHPLCIYLFYGFTVLPFLFGNRIEWAVGSWGSATLFLQTQRREAKLLWSCCLLSFVYSILYIVLDILSF